MFFILKRFPTRIILKIKLSIKGFVKNSIFDFLPSIFSRIILCPLLLLLLIFSCKENPTTPNEPIKPPGYQEDIPWPSLAYSPWPMNHGNPQSTGRSKLIGPASGIGNWMMDMNYNQTSAVIGNQYIYIAPTLDPKGLLSITRDGQIHSQKILYNGSTYEIQTTPLIANDGTIYVCLGLDGILYAFSSDSTIKWQFNNGSSIWIKGMNIDLDGNIYFVDSNKNLVCVDKNGSLLWKIQNDKFNWTSASSLSFSPDGSTLYIPGLNPSVFAVDIKNKIIKWQFGSSEYNAAPMVDCDGNIYINSKAYASASYGTCSLKPDGTINWVYFHNNQDMSTLGGDGTIDKNGNIYFAYDSLYSIKYDGTLNWKISLNGNCESPIICDDNNDIYVPVTDWVTGWFYKISSASSIKWIFTLEPNDVFGFSPSIDDSSKLYLPIWRGKHFYSVK